ncbi:hypothetical protein BaRGS_00036077 [Batillaria attramentaria]|uniref:Uncharacterized protein n=1 Tax=Batillaria attramentaria TaxID=370345 RepID=A0ABD0JCM0_9CAEN
MERLGRLTATLALLSVVVCFTGLAALPLENKPNINATQDDVVNCTASSCGNTTGLDITRTLLPAANKDESARTMARGGADKTKEVDPHCEKLKNGKGYLKYGILPFDCWDNPPSAADRVAYSLGLFSFAIVASLAVGCLLLYLWCRSRQLPVCCRGKTAYAPAPTRLV